MTIIEAAKELLEKYQKEEKEFFISNPGCIMNNHSIRIMCLNKIISENMDKKKIEKFKIECEDNAKQMTGPHGWYIHSQTCIEILNKI